MRCIGDPYDGTNCLHTAKWFAFGAIPDPERNGAPIIVAVPGCDVHAVLQHDWLLMASPIAEVSTWPIEALPEVEQRMAQEGDELWVYERSAA